MRPFAACVIALFACTAVAQDAKPYELKSKDGKFTVTFPGKPMESVQKVPLKGTDKQIVVTNNVVEVGKGAAYIVAYNDYPAGILAADGKKVLEGVRDGNMGKDAELVEDKVGTFGDAKLPMREFTFTKNKLHFRNKLILDGNRLYQVMIVADNEKELTSETAKKYYESFSLAKKK